jgi:hypothetical protein
MPNLKKAELIERTVFIRRESLPLNTPNPVVGSTHAYDLHQKKSAYRRNGVREYLSWITGEKRVVWWQLVEGEFQEISSSEDGLLKSSVFPALLLDTGALLAGDMKAVLTALRRGLDSSECKSFVSSAHGNA